MQRLSRRFILRTATLRCSLSTSASDGQRAKVFEEIVSERRAINAFSEQPLPKHILKQILEIAQLTPTSSNVQPYAVIAVTDAKKRQQLSEAMLGRNVTNVATAPVTVVFAADLEPMKRVPALCELEEKAGLSKQSVARLPATVSLFAGSGVVANGVKRAFLHLTSPLRASPSVSTTQAWSYKNASMVAMTVMLAAQAHGISSCPMEGFDARRVRHVLRLPERYEVPIIVTLGYPKDGYTPRPRARFDFDDVFFENSFGQTFGSEEPATPTAGTIETTPGLVTASRPAGSPDVVLS